MCIKNRFSESIWQVSAVLFLVIFVPLTSIASEVGEAQRLTLAQLQAELQKDPESLPFRLALARKYGQSNQQAALTILYSIPKDSQSPADELHIRALLCEIHIRKGETSQAQPHCDFTMAELPAEYADNISRATAYNAMGYFYIRGGKADLAMGLYDDALQIDGLESEVILVTLLHNRAVSLNLSGLTEEAIAAFESADAVKELLAEDDNLPIILAYNLGYIQAQSGNHEEALKSYASTIPWLFQTNQLARVYISTTQVALSLSGLGRHQEALEELLPLIEQDGFEVTSDSEAQAMLALAGAYLGLGNEVLAEQSLLKGIDIAQSNDNPSRLRELSLVYAGLLLDRGEAQAAAEYLHASLEQLKRSNLRIGLEAAHSLLADAYAAMNDYEQALHHSHEAIEALQASQTETYSRRLAALRVVNELDIKNQQLMLAQERERTAVASQQLSQLIQIAIGMSFLVASVLIYLYVGRRANQREALVQKESANQLKVLVEARSDEVEQALEEKYSADKRKAELEVRVAKDDKLRIIGQLTGGVAHDFNNLMTVVQLSSELLLLNLDNTQKKLVNDILTAVNSGKAITRGLLAYARQQVLQPTVIDLEDYIASNRRIFNRSIDESIQFETELSSENGRLVVKADEGQLTSSILNLILNAREASKAGGYILLAVCRQQNKVYIEVTDRGRGMSEKELNTATEPFYSTKTLTGGSGLGLSMVEGFMKQSGGELLIKSSSGAGTTVQLVFDACEDQLANDEAELIASNVTEGALVLLVEDEEQIQEVAALVLERAGYRVITASNGAEAIDKFAANKDVSLLITDLVMPGGIAGDQLIEELLKARHELPVLLMSGYSENTPTEYPFLSKPFSTESLLNKTKELIGKAG